MIAKNLFLTIFIAFFAVSCGPSETVTRTSAEDIPDLSGRWNDRDARMVSETMIPDALSRPWLPSFVDNEGRSPVVIVGNVRNQSMEHIDTEVFTKDLERELINSGRVRFVAGEGVREAMRAERLDQQQYASLETARNLANETGADFMMVGNISSIYDESVDRRNRTVFYTVNLELIDIETNEKVWIGNEQIRKLIERSRIR